MCSVSSCLLHVTAFWGGDVAQLHDPVPFLLALSMASRGYLGVMNDSQMKHAQTGDAPSCLQPPQHPELSTHAGSGSGTPSAAAKYGVTFSAASALSNRCGQGSQTAWSQTQHAFMAEL